MKQIFITGLVYCFGLWVNGAHATLVTYSGTHGRSASADFSLLNGGNQLQIVLRNTSTPDSLVNGNFNMVLSSLNFDLGGVQIAGGSAVLNAGSHVVTRDGITTDWGISPNIYNLNQEYGYSNTGIGNSGGILSTDEECAAALNSITSSNDGGNAVHNFSDGTPPHANALGFSLVPAGSLAYGHEKFVLDSVLLTLNLNTSLANLNFLQHCSYVEFGSNCLFIPNNSVPTEPVVPEPASLSLIGLGLLGMALRYSRRCAKNYERLPIRGKRFQNTFSPANIEHI